MRILLSNDDGAFAKGIKVMHEFLSQKHQVTVVAPDRNCSGMSNALSLQEPLRVSKLDNGFISVNGTPSDCVQLGINCILKQEPDFVVSGINDGPNLGDDVIYSGTVAAALEGRHMGLPAIAVSMNKKHPTYFETAAQLTIELIDKINHHPLSEFEILNVNVPDLPRDKIKGIQATRLGRRHKSESMIKDKDPFGKTIFWYGKLGKELDAASGTDFYAVNNDFCSVTPLSTDMTVYKQIPSMKNWLNDE